MKYCCNFIDKADKFDDIERGVGVYVFESMKIGKNVLGKCWGR